MKVDAIIIGGGGGGYPGAFRLARSGYNIALIDEKGKCRKENKCRIGYISYR